jgi:excisionase family DNA binding protein
MTSDPQAMAPRLATSAAGRFSDKFTIAEVCADLNVSRRTFYEWRAKGRAPRCIRLPNGDLRIRRSEYQRWLSAREEVA